MANPLAESFTFTRLILLQLELTKEKRPLSNKKTFGNQYFIKTNIKRSNALALTIATKISPVAPDHQNNKNNDDKNNGSGTMYLETKIMKQLRSNPETASGNEARKFQ